MRTPLQLAAFLLIVGGVVFGIHYYLWARYVRDPGLPAPWRLIATVALVALAVFELGALPLSRLLPVSMVKGVSYAAFTWMGFSFLLLMFAAAGDVVRLVLAGASLALRGEAIDQSRRLFLARAVAGTAGAASAALGAVALRNGLGEVEVKSVNVRLARLPRQLDGLTIAQLTDVHVGPTIGRAFIERIVAQTNALKPDLVALTGDLVDGSVESLRHLVEPLAGLKSRYGTFFVTGNHEYYSGADEWMEELRRLGIRVLHNERVTLGDAAGPGRFELAGVDDWTAHGNGHGPDLAKALAGRDPERELVLLAHQPKQIAQAAAAGVGLQLSGHTHGGQIAPFGALVALTQPFLSGLHRQGDAQIYVSQGTGYWGPPMRLGHPAEISKIVLSSS